MESTLKRVHVLALPGSLAVKVPVRSPSVRFPFVAGTEDRSLETPTHAMSGPQDHPTNADECARGACEPAEGCAEFPLPSRAGAGDREPHVSPMRDFALKKPLHEATELKGNDAHEPSDSGGTFGAAPSPGLQQSDSVAISRHLLCLTGVVVWQ